MDRNKFLQLAKELATKILLYFTIFWVISFASKSIENLLPPKPDWTATLLRFVQEAQVFLVTSAVAITLAIGVLKLLLLEFEELKIEWTRRKDKPTEELDRRADLQ